MESRVLVVDDHPIIFLAVQAVAKEVLPAAEVIHAPSLASARLACRNYDSIRLILLDINLPDSRHTEGVGILLEEFSRIPIVVYTGQNDNALRQACLGRGAKDYLLKSTNPTQLFETMSRYLETPLKRFGQDQAASKVAFTARQAQVVKHLIDGLSGPEIAKIMQVSESTIKSFVKTIYGRTQCHNRVEFMRWYSRPEQSAFYIKAAGKNEPSSISAA